MEPELEKLRRELLSRRLAISTIARADRQSAADLREGEYFRWGVGPELREGSIVAIYVPKGAEFLPGEERGRIRHLFSVARDTHPGDLGFPWNNVVFLHRRVTLDVPLTIERLRDPSVVRDWRLPKTNFRSVGKLRDPLRRKEAQVFWRLVLQQNQPSEDLIRQNLLSAPSEELTTISPKEATAYKYDVALSFAGEDRDVARKIAERCKKTDIRVFFDEFETSMLWGKDLLEELKLIYQKRTRYFLPILSSNYVRNYWTKHELESALAKALVAVDEYILPVRLDDTEIPGIRGTIGYVDLRKMTVDQVIGLLKEKLSNK